MAPTFRAVHAACAVAALVAAVPVAAQSTDAAAGYPSRPVYIVVPFGAGSGPDIRARQLGQKLSEQWNQPVVVENRPGASGQIAMDHVARAAPDGYTLVMAGQSNLAIAPNLVKQTYDPLKAFAPVTRLSTGSIILVTSGDLPVQNVAELVEYAKRNPGKLNAASWGTATITHLALERFNQTAGVNITHVPYKGGPRQYINDLLTGRVQIAFEFYPAIGQQVKAGRLKALAVSGDERIRLLPDVPTFTEARMSEMASVSGWQGVAVPAGTPPEIIAKLQPAIARVLAEPDVRKSYLDTGFDTVGDTPEAFTAFIRSEQARWGKLIAAAGIRVE